MPFYKFNCNECNHTYVVKKSAKEISDREECTQCNHLGIRDYGNIQVDSTHEFRDPKSARFWKKNMSTSDQADVIAGTKDPY